MKRVLLNRPLVAIACGGTGGHFFPGLAVAEVLQNKGCDILLLISPKQVDQDAVKSASGMDVLTLPAIGLQNGEIGSFLRGLWNSHRICTREFRRRSPAAVLAMGGFTSAPPVLAGRRFGAVACLHEANSIPGRANRWLAPWIEEAFIAFPGAGRRLATQRVALTGMPVRPQFKPMDSAGCRMALGLAAEKPVLVITGGSQGASGINRLVCDILPTLVKQMPELQFVHLTGTKDIESVRAAYASVGSRSVVLPFLTEMELALGAATLVISRAGASSITEIASMRVPSVLIPYPAAADNHQYFNGLALAKTGAAIQIEQSRVEANDFLRTILDLIRNEAARIRMSEALARWHVSDAAEGIAHRMLSLMGVPQLGNSRVNFMATHHEADHRTLSSGLRQTSRWQLQPS